MGGLLKPADVLFFLLILLILFGSGRFLEIAQHLERLDSYLRVEWNSFRAALFMAKRPDPNVDRSAGDLLTDEEERRGRTQARMLLAILLGNLLYFVSSPLLPSAAVLKTESFPGLPVLVDIWFCLLAFGVLNLVRTLSSRRN